jgi:molecular chaperone IbpA
MVMRTGFDFTPLARSMIGFDHLFDLLENAGRAAQADGWPPYDIVKLGEDDYRIAMAVAGFSEGELSVTQERNVLIVSGERKAAGDGATYLYQGIPQRAFERRFDLADHVEVKGATLANGLLVIDLHREVPEEMRPRRIAIAGPGGARQITDDRQAA